MCSVFVILVLETTKTLFNGHMVQRTEKSMRINCSTNILFNRHNVERIYGSTDIMLNGYTVQRIYKNSSNKVKGFIGIQFP